MIESPSAPSFHLPMKKLRRVESSAVAPMTTQRISLTVYLIDSMMLALGGSGLQFSPNLFMKRFWLENVYKKRYQILSGYLHSPSSLQVFQIAHDAGLNTNTKVNFNASCYEVPQFTYALMGGQLSEDSFDAFIGCEDFALS